MYRFVLILFFVFFVAFRNDSFSITLGLEGESNLKEGITWHPIKFEDEDESGFKALFPGDVYSGISESMYFAYSKFNETSYDIRLVIDEHYHGTEKALLKALNNFLEDEKISYLKKIKEIKKGYECFITNDDGVITKILRVYWAKGGRLYYASVEGIDLSLSNEFFNKIEFKL